MKKNLLIFSFFMVFALFSQEVENKSKVNHAFSLSGGAYLLSELGDNFRNGLAYSFSYQAYFPNRFIFGIYLLTDQGKYKAYVNNNIEEFPDLRKVIGKSAGIQLGVHIVKRERFNFSILTLPHFNSVEYFKKYYHEPEKRYKEQKYSEFLLFVPIAAWRFEFLYKFNQTHGLGLTADTHIDMIPLELDANLLGRIMLSYRFMFPNK